MNVFIADGSVILCKRLVSIISALAGVKATGYSMDAREALKAIRRTKPDVAIIDIHLPRGSGLELLRRVKLEKCTPFVMILTNDDLGGQYQKRCLQAGADVLICKPTELERAVEILQDLLRREAMRRQEWSFLTSDADDGGAL